MRVPFITLKEQLDTAFSTLQVNGLKAVEHEDKEDNSDFHVDPLADPRLDKMDLFNMVDTEDRDAIMNAQSSFATTGSDDESLTVVPTSVDSSNTATPAVGSGE